MFDKVADEAGIDGLVTRLIDLKAQGRKVAFVFSGGGARAAWFAGVLEAIETQVRIQQPNVAPQRRFAPDILVGTSGGGLTAAGYFADIMNPGQYGAYSNRLSLLWRELSRGNRAGFDLLDNPGVLDIVSGSHIGQPTSSMPDFNAPSFYNSPMVGGLGHLPSDLDPSQSAVASFKLFYRHIAKLRDSIENVKAKWTSLWAVLSDLDGIKTEIQNLNLADKGAAEIARILAKANKILAVTTAMKTHFANAKYGKAAVDFLELTVVGAFLPFVLVYESSVLAGKLAALTTSEAVNAHIRVTTFAVRVAQATGSTGLLVAQITALPLVLALEMDDVLKFFIGTIKMARRRSSLMDTTGLENTINRVLANAVPNFWPDDAPGIDAAVFSYWSAQRVLKLGDAANGVLPDPDVRAPELILTASNISANRLTLLTLCDEATNNAIGANHTWVIRINSPATSAPAGPRESTTSSPARWLFSALAVDHVVAPDVTSVSVLINDNADDAPVPQMLLRTASPDQKVADEAPRLGDAVTADVVAGEALDRTTERNPALPPGQATAPATDAPAIANSGARSATQNNLGTAQRHIDPQLIGQMQMGMFAGAWYNEFAGHSLLTAAALTTAAIPVALPPRQWKFSKGGVEYAHWFVDGGICDNRPVQAAIEAGADVVVSFELSPLRKCVRDIPRTMDQPAFGEVASNSLTDTQINASFYRYFEAYVYEGSLKLQNQQPFLMDVWRVAPGAASGKENNTIGVYDFNGYWHAGSLKCGLFDWFMRGYLDAHGSAAAGLYASSQSHVASDYKGLAADFGQLKNAAGILEGPGFYRVDFGGNKPHPYDP